MKRFVIGSLTVLAAILAMLAVLAVLAPAHAAEPAQFIEVASVDTCPGFRGTECIRVEISTLHIDGQEPTTVLIWGVNDVANLRVIVPTTETPIPAGAFTFDAAGGLAAINAAGANLVWHRNGAREQDGLSQVATTEAGVTTWFSSRQASHTAHVTGSIGGYAVTGQPAWLSENLWVPGGSLVLTAIMGRRATVALAGGFGNYYDWLTVVPVGAPLTSFPQWVYVGAGVRNRTWTTAPLAPGRYEFRYFRDDGFDLVARSAPFTIP